MPLAIGDRVGPYRVIAAHPAGGARATSDKVRVHLELADDWRASARLASEVAGLEHPGIAKIVDRGVLSDHRAWLATEIADGMPLAEVMGRRVLAVDETLELIRDVSSILTHLHERGLVHDGIKPQAITLRTGTRPFPIQLGSWTQLRAGDGSADLHALGVLAYRAVTGRFPGLHVPELVPGIPGGLSSLIVRMLAADPEERPTAANVFAEVARLHGDRSLTGPRFQRPRWTPQPDELHPVTEAITLPLKRI